MCKQISKKKCNNIIEIYFGLKSDVNEVMKSRLRKTERSALNASLSYYKGACFCGKCISATILKYLQLITFPSFLLPQFGGAVWGAEATTGTYSVSKMAAGRYQRAVQQFCDALQAGGLGTWPRSPQKLCHFHVSM